MRQIYRTLTARDVIEFNKEFENAPILICDTCGRKFITHDFHLYHRDCSGPSKKCQKKYENVDTGGW